MGLQVWLPLDGNLKNLGCKNVTVTNSGATVDTNGKIGKCYSFDGTDDKIYANNVSISVNSWSLVSWVYPIAYSSDSHQYLVGLNTSTAEDFTGVLCWYKNNFGIRTGGVTYSPSGTLSLNNWYHVVATYGNNILKLYVNGQLVKTQESPATPVSASNLYLGVRGGNIGYFRGKLNDVRIYDHCLSTQEVKKIAQGLVIHYPFDNRGFGKENLLIGSNDFSGWVIDNGGRWTVNNNIVEYSAGALTWQSLSSPTILWSSVEGKDITFSCEVRSDNSVYTKGQYLLYCQIGRKGIATGNYGSRRRTLQGLNINTSGSVPTTWKKYSRTIKNIQDSSFTETYNGGGGDYFGLWFWGRGKDASVQIKNIKLQISEIPTPWNFNSSDTKYTALGLNDTRIADISGFGNNGIRNNITYDYLTKVKYGKSAMFNGTNSYIKCNTNNWMVQGAETISYSFWACEDSWNNSGTRQLLSCTQNGGFSCVFNNSTITFYLHVYTNADKTGVTYPGTLQALTHNFSYGWHHFVFTYKKQSYAKIYVDGILFKSVNLSSSYGVHYNTSARLFLGCQASTASPASPYFNGKMSDFRFYVTQLSEEDVKDLYNYNKPEYYLEEESQDVEQSLT